MTPKQGMAATYTPITLEEMETYLKRAFRILRPKQGSDRGEIYFDLTLGKFVGIRVWTSIRPHSGVGAQVGTDVIRVGLISLKDHGGLEKGEFAKLKRTQGWRDSIKKKIEALVEKYEDNDEFWENWAETRKRQGDPERAMQQEREERSEEERARDEDGEGDDGVEEPSPTDEPRMLDEIATWAKCSDRVTWGVAVVDPDAKEGDKVRTRTQDGDESVVTLAQFDRAQYGKRIFYKGKQEGGRPQRSRGYGYDRRRC